MPNGWQAKAAKKGIGTKYVNPKNPNYDYIRFSSKNLDPRAPIGQIQAYFQRHKNG